MIVEIPKAVVNTAANVAPKVVELIILDPVIVRAGIKKSTVFVIAGLAFLLGVAAQRVRINNGLDQW